MDQMMSNMLLPAGFFMFSRKVIGQIVLEKEKGLIEYLKINGMKEAAYNLSFILHESLINGLLICVLLDTIVYKRQAPDAYSLSELACFNLATILFLVGITTFSLLISKAFSSPGFASQIGSIIYMVPIFLSLYLKVLEMKHNFSQQVNQNYSNFGEDGWYSPQERNKEAELLTKLNQSDLADLQLYPKPAKKHQKLSSKFGSWNSSGSVNWLIEDRVYFWESFAQNALNFSPHTLFCDLATNIFAADSDKKSAAYFSKMYTYQLMDFALLFTLLLVIENWQSFKKGAFNILSPKQTNKSHDLPENSSNRGPTPVDLAQNSRRSAIEFVGMTKMFGQFVAVDDMSLSLYKDEIFCFLGHNGAGKTTSLNVLMGKMSPTHGTVKIHTDASISERKKHEDRASGATLDIREDVQHAQSLMGTCSQHDILFETLTVEQHMYLFFKLKESLLSGTQKSNLKPISQRIDNLIATVQLEEHRHKQSQNLSGGMRRRLSIALALASPAESSIVILDEPTTGLDAMVRDDVWQLIKKLKHDRCIVMTTQHLQEAEELADQVALLDMGQVRAKGSVDEIKKRFGIGYNLIVSHEPGATEIPYKYEQSILSNVPGSFYDPKMSSDLKSCYTLPFQAIEMFPQMFELLESSDIKFSLKQTSLEDAFLNFTQLQKSDVTPSGTDNGRDSNKSCHDQNLQAWKNFDEFMKLDGIDTHQQQTPLQLFNCQFQAMFLKRWYSFKRDYRMWLIMILPSAIISLFLMLGFQREYTPSSPIKYANQILGQQFTGNLSQFGSELTKNLTKDFDPYAPTSIFGSSDSLSSVITGFSELTMYGDKNKSMNLTLMGQKMQDTVNHPSMENMFKTLMTLSQGEGKDTDDPELQELQQLVSQILKEDLQLDSPWDMLTFGMKYMANSAYDQQQANQEMLNLQQKIQDRLQKYYEKKMAPVLRQMAREQAELMMIEAIRYMKEIIYLIWIIFSLSQCSGIAVEHPVLEREIQMRYYLNVIGIGQAAYWCGNFAFDIGCYYFQAIIMVGLVYPLKLSAYQNEVGSMIALMALFGPAHTLFSYFISFGFSKPQSALKFISIAYMLSGFVIPFVLKIISLGVDRCEGKFYIVSQLISQGIPLHPMSQGLKDLLAKGHWGFFDQQMAMQNEMLKKAKDRVRNDESQISKMQQIFLDYQTCDGYVVDVTTALHALALSCLASILLIIFIERIKLFYFQGSEQSYQQANTFETSGENYCLQTSGLNKVYSGKLHAVKNVSFNLKKRGEIIGLLGANGAGKSSTFNMVTMQIKRTSGDIQIFDKQIQNISYLQGLNITAQQDILWPYLSIEEHLQIISLVQGHAKYANRFSALSSLLELDKPEKHALILSGGNKRKLSTAMTLMTAPKLAFFDEPTVGLDPVARRQLLDLIKRSATPVLFTTHRLDEAEYLCTRVAIMKQGSIIYDGPIDGIKDSFQAGCFSQQTPDQPITSELQKYSLSCQGLVLVKEPQVDLTERLGYLEIDQRGVDHALYRILKNDRATGSEVYLSRIFADLLHLKSQESGHLIKDFTYYQPSLHHAFVAINQQQPIKT